MLGLVDVLELNWTSSLNLSFNVGGIIRILQVWTFLVAGSQLGTFELNYALSKSNYVDIRLGIF